MQRYLITECGVKENCTELQTQAVQAVLDLCRDNGGIVVIPRGRFYVSSLRMWSNTTLYLSAGAELFGSDDCNDYEIYEIPAHVEMRSDMEMIPQQYNFQPWEAYRRAIITAYGEKNISIIGERDSVIDGANCYDPDGEEGYRGPHAIFFSCCENVHLEGYTARHSGNFLHEANNCQNITMRRVTCLGGSDGIHLHCSRDTLIEECVFRTGDDCIAGINVERLTVRRCVFNTSCNLFRIGGVDILVEECHAYGPGYYPHRMTIVKGKHDELPREAGRHNMLSVVTYFASDYYTSRRPSDITFRNCLIENARGLMRYEADNSKMLHSGSYWATMTLENVHLSDLKRSSQPMASAAVPLTVRMKNVTWTFADEAESDQLFELAENCNVTVIEE